MGGGAFCGSEGVDEVAGAGGADVKFLRSRSAEMGRPWVARWWLSAARASCVSWWSLVAAGRWGCVVGAR